MTYQCPVCGYDELERPPKDYSICDSCGTEFESDDFDRTHAELRHEWISRDMPWFSRSKSAPKNWSPYRQLIIAGYGHNLIAHPRIENDEAFRYAIDEAFSDVRIAKQLRLLRETRKQPLTQSALAQKSEMKQSRISELEGMNYSSWTVSTLRRLAQALGVRFTFAFEGWRDLEPEIESGLTSEALSIPSFEDEPIQPDATAALVSSTGYTYSTFVYLTHPDIDHLAGMGISEDFAVEHFRPKSRTATARTVPVAHAPMITVNDVMEVNLHWLEQPELPLGFFTKGVSTDAPLATESVN